METSRVSTSQGQPSQDAPPEAGQPRSEQLLTFIVDDREYGVDILRVQEIRGWSPAMPIPNAPPYLRGVINIRGDIVPIADLRHRLGLPSLDYGETTVVVVLRVQFGGKERVMGIIVDAMSDVTSIPTSCVRPPPVLQDGKDALLARGIAALQDKMLTILDVDQIFQGVPVATGITP
jgi:purine-binding chemotaxis protein CheW